MTGLNTPLVPYSRPSTPGIPQQLGFVGIGAMGYQMARNLAVHKQKSSHPAPPLLVWNRSLTKAQDLLLGAGEGNVRIAQDLGQLAIESDIIFTCLANDAAVKSVFEEIVSAIKATSSSKSRIFVEMSTIYPSLAGELDGLVSTLPHSHLVTSPVVGRPAVADKAQLVIIMSGDYRAKKEVAHILFPAVGRKVIDLGENLEKAPTYKLIANSMILGSLEVLAEAYTLGEKSGIGAENVHRLVEEIFPAPGMLAYSERMKTDNFDGSQGFGIEGGIKDASHIRRLTTKHNSPMPSIDVAHQHLITARALHITSKLEGKDAVETLDWTGIVAGARVAAGLDAFDSDKHTRIVRED